MNSRYNLSTPEAVEVCWHRRLACSSSRRDNRRRPSPSMFPSNCVSSRLFFWVFFFLSTPLFLLAHILLVITSNVSQMSGLLLHAGTERGFHSRCEIVREEFLSTEVELTFTRRFWMFCSTLELHTWVDQTCQELHALNLLKPFFWCLTIFKQNV